MFYKLFGAILFIVLVSWIAGFGLVGKDFEMNLFTEVMGIAATVLIIDERRKYVDTAQLKERLIREAGSRSNDIALSAADQLRNKEWLTGDVGLLRGAKLNYANLQNANLH